jgi:hypothetical protein
MSQKYLTKSLFNVGHECPRKLYYQTHKDLYQDNKLEDPFLAALAEGGFQVGALAKIYHPEGIDLSDFSTGDSIFKTSELLKQENVTIFEPTFIHESLLVRVDILRKVGSNIELFEVKAKSFDPREDQFFYKRNNLCIMSAWEKYLYDIAFQAYVCRKSLPDFTVTPFLTLVNKNSSATVEALNQRFLITKDNGRTKILVASGTNQSTVGDKVLTDIDVSKAVSLIIENKLDLTKKTNEWDRLPFESKISELTQGLLNDQKLTPRLDGKCKKCEFRCNPTPPLKSGFNECWTEKISVNYINEPLIFDIWNFRSESVLKSGRFLAKELKEDDFFFNTVGDNGLTQQQRQWLQVSKIKEKENSKYIDLFGLSREIAIWKYPLHFIDFETSRVAIPFTIGRRPYEQIAFQFSHHVVNKDGTIEHINEYINAEPGVFPNFDFVRSLKKALELDSGTIFRFHNHENTVLCEIIKQLESSNETDKDSLIDWIKTITKQKDEWEGERAMMDLCELVKKYYYHPHMGGSNGLKSVLPAVLQDSKFLQEKYIQPIYGTQNGIKSLNYENWCWIKFDQKGSVIDPYQSLPKLFEGVDPDELDTLFEDAELNNGGAAMTAYARMQFTEMSRREREELRSSLLKYCELDTFAMVLLYEYFLNEAAEFNLLGASNGFKS